MTKSIKFKKICYNKNKRSEKMQKKKSKKSIFLIIGIIVVICIGVIAYLVISDLKQEDLLKKEIVNVSNKDLLTDNYDIEVKTTGDYAYVEEAVKKFYKELSDSVKTMSNYLNDEELTNILSAENLANDGPHFQKSYQILEDARKNSTEAIEKIANLCDEETIKNLIAKDKVSNYYYELYQKLMYTEDDLKEFAETKQEMQTLSENLNIFLDKVKEMLNMLENNSNSWVIENGQLYFETDELVAEYNTLYQELNQIATEKFADYNTQTTNDNIKKSDI